MTGMLVGQNYWGLKDRWNSPITDPLIEGGTLNPQSGIRDQSEILPKKQRFAKENENQGTLNLFFSTVEYF